MRLSNLVLALIIVSSGAHAATIFKCVDAQGNIHFTANANCPENHDLNDVMSVDNPTISRSGESTLMAPTRNGVARTRQTVAGATQHAATPASPSSPCSTGLNARDLRTAKVRGEIVPGMTRSEIQKIYGNATNKGAQGAGGSTYWSDRYKQVVSVNYDRNGCTQSSYQSGYKP